MLFTGRLQRTIERHNCFCVPNNDDLAGQANYPKLATTLSGLAAKLEFNSIEVVKQSKTIEHFHSS